MTGWEGPLGLETARLEFSWKIGQVEMYVSSVNSLT